MLVRAMPDVMIWLGACASLGMVNGLARLMMLVRSKPAVVSSSMS
jgi:coenzyme F420-reducing hydrogenase gamma subunit